MKSYIIKEIFGPTIQGEGSQNGKPVKFLRFAGCNRWDGRLETKGAATCFFCDTDFRDGTKMTAQEIVQGLDALGPIRHVVLSGGEPTLQIDEALVIALANSNYILHLETNGSKPLGALWRYFYHVTVSPKQGRHETKIERAHDLKLLYPPIRTDITIEEFDMFPTINKFLQPLELGGDFQKSAAVAVEKLYQFPAWRLSLQTHKILGVK